MLDKKAVCTCVGVERMFSLRGSTGEGCRGAQHDQKAKEIPIFKMIC